MMLFNLRRQVYPLSCGPLRRKDANSVTTVPADVPVPNCDKPLIHWGRVTHLCVGKLTIIGSDNGLSPGRRQAIICTNAGLFLIGHLATNFSEILIAIETFSFKKKHLKISSGKCRPFCFGFNVLKGTEGITYLNISSFKLCMFSVDFVNNVAKDPL